MRTSEETKLSGIYVSDCCEVEHVFDAGDTAWRCPQCHHLCEWELVNIGDASPDREPVGVAAL